MERVAEIQPQRISISAPLELVYELMTRVEYECIPGTGRSVSVISEEPERVVAAFSSTHVHGQTTVLKEILPSAPGRVKCRHIAGPFIGTREEIMLQANGFGTDVVSTAVFPASGTGAARLFMTGLEHAAYEHLCDIKAAAEAREHPVKDRVEYLSPDPVNAITTEEQLLDAVSAQEEAEWGHVGHGRGVSRVAMSLAESIMLPKRQTDALVRAALLHDVGKICLSSNLWGSRSVLSDDDRRVMQSHAQLGADLATRVGLPDPVIDCILHHHERWDGAGYPAGIAGDAIPLRARILGIAERVDTMMRASYRRVTLTQTQMLNALEEGSGSSWDPMLAREAGRIIRGK